MLLSLAKKDPALFFQRFPTPLLIDEIQYAPELLPYIKLEVDRNRTPGSCWLTGSQPFHLMKGVSESLAGRVGVVQLLGLARKEWAGRSRESRPFLPTLPELRTRTRTGENLPLKELYRLIWRGGFPAIALNERVDRNLFYSSYVQTYLQRDIRDLARVGDEMSFLCFLRAAAAAPGNSEPFRAGPGCRYRGRHREERLSILQASGVTYLLEPFHTNVTKRLVKTPKLYFLDTGLCAYLTEWSSPETLASGRWPAPSSKPGSWANC